MFRRLIARLCHRPTEAKPVVRVQTRESWKMRLDEWRKEESLVSDSMRLARDSTYRAQLDILRNEHPCHLVFQAIGVNPNDRIAQQAKIEGYELCLNNLEAMAKPFKQPAALVETFEPPETSKRK